MTRDYRDVSLWFDQLGAAHAAAGAGRRPRGRRRDRRGRVHRAVDRVLPAGGRPGAAHRRARAGDRRLRRVRPQRRLVLGAVPGHRRHPGRGGRRARPPARSTRRCATSVAEVVRVARAEGIEADIATGGTVVLARSQPQLDRARDEVAESEPLRPRRRPCSTPTPPAPGWPPPTSLGATLHAALRGGPAGQARPRAGRRRRARAARDRTSTRRSPRVEPHAVHTDARHGPGAVRRAGDRGLHGPAARPSAGRRAGVLADHRHRAAARRRSGTRSGCAQRETFSDHRHLIVYGQRSADGRMVFGGRGAPYHFGSRIAAGYDRVPAGVRRAAARRWSSCSRCCATPRITHRWGGPLGIARDWHASVGLDPRDRPGLGRRLRRRRRVDDQPGRPHAGRPDHRPRHRADRGCPGSGTAAAGGSPSRCAGSASTPGCGR